MAASTADDWDEVDDFVSTTKTELPLRTAPTPIKEEHKPTKYICSSADFLTFSRQMVEHASKRLTTDLSPIFLTGAFNLYDAFIKALPADMHQEYTCITCRHFVKKFGSLGQVTNEGELVPLFWSGAYDKPFKTAVAAMASRFEGRKVWAEFKVRQKTIGDQEKGGFNHMYMSFPNTRVQEAEFNGFGLPALHELSKMLERILADYDTSVVRRAVKMLEENKLPQADNHKAAARWLLDTHNAEKKLNTSDPVKYHNWISRRAAEAFIRCLSQLRSGALSTLLDDLKAGNSWKVIEHRWKGITDPINYLRPQAAPKEGNILASERLFTQLGLTKEDMRRRFLVGEDIPRNTYIWRASQASTYEKKKPELSIFAEVKAKITPQPSTKGSDAASSAYEISEPASTISFTKFVNKILPTAAKLEYRCEDRNTMYFLTTGLKGNKPLMQWHTQDGNQASWYVYHEPDQVDKHGLKKWGWNEVTAVIPLPHLWDGVPLTTTFPIDADAKKENSHIDGDEKTAEELPAYSAHAPGSQSNDSVQTQTLTYYHKKNGFRYMFVLSNIIDKKNNSLCLFPTLLKGEFHGARATIEAYSNAGKKEFVEGYEKKAPTEKGGYVGGPVVSEDMKKGKHVLRVTDRQGDVGVYEIVVFE